MSEKQKIFFTVQNPQDQGHTETFHDYSQIQIVNCIVPTSPVKKKFIFLEDGAETTEIYGNQYDQGSSFTFTEGGKAPLILDPNVSGAVESVIEVTNHENIGINEGVILLRKAGIGKCCFLRVWQEGQTTNLKTQI